MVIFMRFSVIIPNFNRENVIKNAIDSVINQTFGFENIELIIVDDCSTDGSCDVINEYASKYDNINPIFLDKNNGGPSIPRNIGIENASNEWVMFLDSDDEYDLDFCKKADIELNSLGGG